MTDADAKRIAEIRAHPARWGEPVIFLLSVIAERDAEIARLRASFADELQAMVATDRARIAKLEAALR